jgi:hypothetical protein
MAEVRIYHLYLIYHHCIALTLFLFLLRLHKSISTTTPQHGCFDSEKGLECGKEGTSSASLSALPENYKPLALTDSMDEQWLNLIKDLSLQ